MNATLSLRQNRVPFFAPIPRRRWPWILLGSVLYVMATSRLGWAQTSPTIIAAAVSPAPTAPLQTLFTSLAAGSTPTSFSSGTEVPFAKIAMAFDPPLKDIQQITVTSCDGSFRDGVEFFTFPGLERFYGEGGLAEATARLPAAQRELRSLAIGLRRNKDACLKALVFKDSHGKVVAFHSALRESASAAIPPDSATSGRQKTDAKADVKLKDSFSNAGLADVLDQELTPKSDDDHWIFRFRSDGTFFVYGQAPTEDFSATPSESSHEASRFSAIGEFRVEQTSKSSVKITLEGERFTTPGPWDGWYCGHSCGRRDPASVASVADPLTIEKLPNGSLMIRNRANRASRGLPLSDLPVRTALYSN